MFSGFFSCIKKRYRVTGAGRRSASGGDYQRASFVEVGLSHRVLAAGSGNTIPSAGYEVVLPQGVVVRVPSDFDPAQVTGLLRAVASAC